MSGLRLPRALVPYHHRSASILALRNDAFEAAILDRMIFHLDREPLIRSNVAWPFRNRPALQHTVPPEPKVIVQMRCGMFLNNKRELLLRERFSFTGAAWLAGYLEVSHRAIALKLLSNRIRRGSW